MAEYILLLAAVMGMVAVFRVVFLQNIAPRLEARTMIMRDFDTRGLDRENIPVPNYDTYYVGFGGAHADAEVIVR